MHVCVCVCVCVCVRARAQLCLTLCNPMACKLPGFCSVEFSRQEHWSGLPLRSPKNLPNPGTELTSPALAGGCLGFLITNKLYIY